ncbi:AhpC/TSA family protein [Sinomicrobium kalidii]|uniref:TlpA disulfide reductase family protein n=1 Tax=Sinomicrobium kalidii TaxID=2900738 RepID=UPI001E4FD27B|nr:TlpA disulfide reductase family protein [Sinomicrobium kalidii]UGU16018.1 AhpC/TSA family protein [Sinomicrobium kalidii]
MRPTVLKPALIILLPVLFACQENKEDPGFLITGDISDNYEGYIYLDYNDILDSTLVEDASFRFKGKVSQPLEATLLPGSPTSGESMTVASFMLENSTIDISLKYDIFQYNGSDIKGLDMDSISGSTSQKLKEDFEAKMEDTFAQEENDSIREAILYDNLSKFIKTNPQSVLSGQKLASLSNFYGYLKSEQMQYLLEQMDTTYQDKKDLRYIRNIIERRKILNIGKTPPKIELPNPEGKLVDSDSLRGNYVLYEFWASWCSPCRKTNPELSKVYSTFHKDGFEILGVSIDKSPDKWKTAIQEDKLKWIQVIDSLNKTGEKYRLTTIPYNVLQDRKGKIIARNVKPEKLREILTELTETEVQ